jgi:hypothetical protein
LRKPPCEGTDQFAVRIETENFKARDAALLEAAAIVLDGSFLGCLGHQQLLSFYIL